MKTNLSHLILALAMTAACLLSCPAHAQQQPAPQPVVTSGDPVADEYNQLKADMTQQIDQLEKDMSASATKVNDSVDRAKAIEKEYGDAVAISADAATLKAISERYSDAVTEAINLRQQFIAQADKAAAALDQTMKTLRDPRYSKLVQSDIDAFVAQIGRLQKLFEPVRTVDALAQPVLTRLVAALIAMPQNKRDNLTDREIDELFQQAAQTVLERKTHS